jgi:hypothetical protein
MGIAITVVPPTLSYAGATWAGTSETGRAVAVGIVLAFSAVLLLLFLGAVRRTWQEQAHLGWPGRYASWRELFRGAP